MTNKELIQKFEKLVSEERRVTREVLEHIVLIERRKAYFDLGFDGMYAYLTKGLGYSDGAAYRRLQASRVLHVDRDMGAKLDSGKLNLTQLAQVAKASRQSEKPATVALFRKLEEQGKSQSQQIIAQTFDLPIVEAPKLTHQRDESVRFEVSFSKEQFAELEKAKSQLSHICPDGDWASVITELAKQLTKKYELKSTTNKSIEESAPKTPPARRRCVSQSSVGTGNGRRYLSLHLRRSIMTRANGHCEYCDPKTGRRCSSNYQPQFDHIRPLSKGGSDELSNIQLLCGVHNRLKSNRYE